MRSWLLCSQFVIASILVLGHLGVAITQRDFFPFSPYSMYSNTYTPKHLSRKQVVLVYENQQRENFKIQNYFPSLWNAAFMESLFYNSDQSNHCIRLKDIMLIHDTKFPSLKLESVELWQYWLPWDDFTKNTINKTKNHDRLQKKLLVTCQAMAI